LRQPLIAAACHGKLQPAARTADVETVRLERKGAYTGNLAGELVYLFQDLLLRPLALVPWGEAENQKGAVGAALAYDGECCFKLSLVDQRLERGFDLLELARHVIEADALRGRNAHHRSRAIFARRQFVFDAGKHGQRCTGKEQGDEHHDQWCIQAELQASLVEIGGKVTKSRQRTGRA